MRIPLISLPVLNELHTVQDAESWIDQHGPACGECRACCTVHRTVSAAWEVCPHECEHGCAIHADRPQACRDYACLWRSGILEGDERRRPDNLGLVFEAGVTPGGLLHFIAWEVRVDASKEDTARWVINRLAAKKLVVVYEWGGGRVELYGSEQESLRWLAENRFTRTHDAVGIQGSEVPQRRSIYPGAN